MKKLLFVLLLAIVSGQSFASEVITVSRREIGKQQWPLTREEIMLSCDKDGGLFAINDSTLMQYPLNAIAQRRVESKQIQGQSITVIQADDKQHPGQKMDLTPLITRAQALCDA
ncbi:YebY family protein [Rosenbergiella australiborealis]|uniref:YebY family protein n=1 Tax=Rosenbergiella australiborealis TaxID=1544696 RepID=A0ABS5T1P8_9GAMM|nr:YebY family protein [Rosenbergiella australiborealis]MBT0726277.1 YebY family protein [Rosenbergiella australiborealis]